MQLHLKPESGLVQTQQQSFVNSWTYSEDSPKGTVLSSEAEEDTKHSLNLTSKGDPEPKINSERLTYLSIGNSENPTRMQIQKIFSDLRTTSIPTEPLKFVNRESQAETVLGLFLQQKGQILREISNSSIVAIGQPFGIGKTWFVHCLRDIAKRNDYYTQVSKSESDRAIMNDLENALYFRVDMRFISWQSTQCCQATLVDFYCQAWTKHINEHWGKSTHIEVLKGLNKSLPNSNNLVQFFHQLDCAQIPLLVHLDEIDGMNNNPTVQIEGRAVGTGELADYLRIRELWTSVLPTLTAKKLFIILTSKYPYLSVMKHGYVPLPENITSPSNVAPVYLSALRAEHIKQILLQTMLKNAPGISIMDVLRYLGLSHSLEDFFYNEVVRFTAGIPRIIAMMIEGLLSYREGRTKTHSLRSKQDIVDSLVACKSYLKQTDLRYTDVSGNPSRKMLLDRLILIGALGIPIDVRCKVLIDGRQESVITVLKILNFLYEIEQDQAIIKVPYYSILDKGLNNPNDSYVSRWSAALLSHTPFHGMLSKDLVFQEIILQSMAAKMALQRGKKFKEVFPFYASTLAEDYEVNLPVEGQCITLFPAYINQREARDTQTYRVKRSNRDNIMAHPWSYKLQRSSVALKSLFEHRILKEGSFGRPAPKSVGEDANFTLKFDEKNSTIEMILYQFKMYSDSRVCWAIINEEIEKCSTILHDPDSWKIKICVHMVVLGLGTEVKHALQLNGGPLVLQAGHYRLEKNKGIVKCLEEKKDIIIPDNVELLLMGEKDIASIVGEQNMKLLHGLNGRHALEASQVTSLSELLLSTESFGLKETTFDLKCWLADTLGIQGTKLDKHVTAFNKHGFYTLDALLKLSAIHLKDIRQTLGEDINFTKILTAVALLATESLDN